SDESLEAEPRGALDPFERERLPLNRSGGVMRVDEHRHGAALDEEGEDRSADQDEPEGADEGRQCGWLRGECVGDRREDVAQAALEQRGGIAANECRNEN